MIWGLDGVWRPQNPFTTKEPDCRQARFLPFFDLTASRFQVLDSFQRSRPGQVFPSTICTGQPANTGKRQRPLVQLFNRDIDMGGFGGWSVVSVAVHNCHLQAKFHEIAMSLITLFDKSFLQSLSINESVWFDQFFLANVCPYFYVETLADLEKNTGDRRPEDEVRIIADKFPDNHGIPNALHKNLCVNELLGPEGRVPLTGQIPVEGGKPVRSGSTSAIAYDEFPEALAFSRWQKKQFHDLEREFATRWRRALDNANLASVSRSFQKLGLSETKCKNLGEARRMAKAFVDSRERKLDRAHLALLLLGIDRQYHYEILERWSVLGYKPIALHAPYCAHVVEVELFFQFALQGGQISPERASNRVDIAYLFYLPFCRLFVSSDRLHRQCAPLFLRPEQEFVWGVELKDELKKLNDHYSNLPEATRSLAISRFAARPPQQGDFLVSRLYDRHFPQWRATSSSAGKDESNGDAELLKRINEIKKAPPLSHDEIDFDLQAPDALALHRIVRRRKGSWYQLPKDLK